MRTFRLGLKQLNTGQSVLELTDLNGNLTLPGSQLILDYVLSQVPDAALALASIISFRKQTHGCRILGPKVSPVVSSSILTNLQPGAPVFETAETPPTPPLAQTELFFTDDLNARVLQPSLGPRRVLVTVLDSASWSGRLFNLDRLIVSANLTGLAGTITSRQNYLAAVGLLLSGDLKARKIVIESPDKVPQEVALTCLIARTAGFDIQFLSPTQFQEALVADAT